MLSSHGARPSEASVHRMPLPDCQLQRLGGPTAKVEIFRDGTIAYVQIPPGNHAAAGFPYLSRIIGRDTYP